MPHTFERRGAEILVNTAVTGSQIGSNVAALNDGGFVVVWTDPSGEGGDASSNAVKAQRFDADGNKVGGEFLVNTEVTNSQGTAQIATLPSGRYVVTWTDSSGLGGDASGTAIKGQIFEANGSRVGGEFLINTETANNQGPSTVTELAGGGFVVSWADGSLVGGDASGQGIKAQLFDAAGAKVGGEILVNTVTSGSQTSPSIASLGSGGFAVAWSGAFSSGGGGIVTGSIRVQLFDAAGAKVGSETIANSSDFGTLNNAKVTAISSGFVVTWSQSESALGGGNFDVKAQLFDTSGAKVGAEFTVNTTTDGSQTSPDVDALPGGGFLVTWQGPGAALTGTNVYGQVFDAAGAKVGVEFVVSSITEGAQTGLRVDVLASGDVVAMWSDNSGSDGDDSGFAVKAQILTISTAPPTDISLSDASVSETAREDVPLITLHATGTLNSSYVYTILSDSSGGAFAIDGDKLVVHDNSLLDYETHPQVTLLLRATDDNGNSVEESVQFDIADTPEGGYSPITDEFTVHTTVADNQSEPLITPLEGGGYLVLWREWIPFGGASVGKGRIFDADGHPVTGELALDGFAAAARAGGGFILATAASDGSGTGVVARIYDAAGAQVGSTIPVNTSTTGEQTVDSVAVLSSGSFVVTWTDFAGGASQGDVKAQMFDAEGVPVGGEFVVPTVTTGDQEQSEVVALASGGFVVTWWGDGAVRAQVYSASGVRFGPPITVAADSSIEAHVTALSNGGFVVAWDKNTSSGGFTSVAEFSAQVFDASGARVGDVILIDPGLARVVSTDISALPWGGFVVTWAGYDDASTNDPGIRAQVFDGTGSAVGSEFFVSDPAFYEQYAPDVGVLASGDFVVGWTDGTGANGFDTKTRIYSLVTGPTEGDDVLTGTTGDDVMSGLGGNDTLTGGDGNDQLDGGTGVDSMYGGTGNDFYYVDNAGDVVVENNGEGDDRVFAAISYALTAGAEVETLTTTANDGTGAIDLTGSNTANFIYGNDGANTLRGAGGNDVLASRAGNDVLDGGTGVDTMYGGTGNDFYYVDNAGDVVVENAGEGDDRVFASVSYALAASAEVETLTTTDNAGTAAIDLTGSGTANFIYGNDGANTLRGAGGNDILASRAGNDVLDGGTGADTMIGQTGNDWYFVDNAGDIVVEDVGEGDDRVFASASYALAASAEVETLTTTANDGTAAIDLTGSGTANFVYGNDGVNTLRGAGGNDTLASRAGNDVLDGGTGADTMIGGTGNDFYYVDQAGDVVVENVGEGDDRVFASVSYALASGAEVETLTTTDNSATTAIDLTGSNTANFLYGNDGTNSLRGAGGDDFLASRAGNDTLDGGTGNDNLHGGAGADTFAFTTSLGVGNIDTILDFGSGTDKIALDHGVFTGLGLGALPASAFVVGTVAQDADDRIIYDQATGKLWFDADGNGAGVAVQFATLTDHPVISAGDFTVI